MWAFLAAAVGPLAIRVLVALGFASVSFAGATAALGQLTSYAQQQWAGLPADMLALASICQVHTGLGIIFGAFTARIGIWAAANGSKLIFKG